MGRSGLGLGQFYGPVGMVEELFPAFVSVGAEMQADYGVAFGFFGFLDEFHMGLFGGSAAFFYIAGGTGAHDIGPGAFAPQGTRHDMIERQLGGGEFFAAILTATAVPRKDIAPVELDGLTRQAVIKQQADDAGHGDVQMHRGDPIVFVGLKGAFGLTDLLPSPKIIIGIGAFFAGDDFGLFPTQQRKRPACADNAQGHIMLVQHKDMALQAAMDLGCLHCFTFPTRCCIAPSFRRHRRRLPADDSV